MLHFLCALLRLLGKKRAPAKPVPINDALAAAELDARFREALATGEITGDIVAVDKQGREVKDQRHSYIFDA